MIYFFYLFAFLFSKEEIIVNEDFLLTVAFILAVIIIIFKVNTYYNDFYINTVNTLISEIATIFTKKQNAIYYNMHKIEKVNKSGIKNMINTIYYYVNLVKFSQVVIKKDDNQFGGNTFFTNIKYFSFIICEKFCSKKVIS